MDYRELADGMHLVTFKMSEARLVDVAKANEPAETLESFYARQELKPDVVHGVGYRVQVGAYRLKCSADRLCTKIVSLTGKYASVYEDAKVYKIDGLYKVQVGCFKYKTSADSVKRDLISQWFNAFITTTNL